jgi:hypothetical protein
MVQAGVPCLYCHSEAAKPPVAGMPSVAQCMGCHKVIKADSPEIKKVAGYWERQEPIPWVRVNRLPRFVYFSQQVHTVVAALNCERCHGDVGQMGIARPVVQMNMSCRGDVIRSRLLDLTATAFIGDPGLKNYTGRELNSGEGRWSVAADLDQAMPVSAGSAALDGRFESRGDANNTDGIFSVVRKQGNGHDEKSKGS